MDNGAPSGSPGTVVTHFGVKGMHWGVKRASSSATGSNDGHQSEDSANVRNHLATIEKHGIKALSNKELQEVVSRMNLAQQYSNLTGGSGKSSIDKGHDAAKKILAVHTTLTKVHKAYNSPGMKAVRIGLKTAKAARKASKASGSAGGHAVKFVAKQLMK